ncbi:unnamed protein product [Microthlaspi erraticum]|uniref:DUF1985 domain-containing protein n=1 Tax=Microthlaspi erraticum TaxID=1685480 RepID=A0A6D2JKZ4_9BRAS|nr:unnamed protein product [Microthlaspi erraticum]
MEKPTFPRRLYTRGAEPEAQKSISYGSNDKKLFAAVKKLLSDAEWETLCDSRVGVFCKFHDLKFEWSSKLVHTMLSYQLECKKKYEIWSAVADSPIRFSLHEFEHLTGLNCDYVEDLGDPKCKVTLEMRAFWEKLGVGVELGPSQVELIRACEWATDWPSEDKLRLGYLAIYTGFIAARKNTSHTPVNLARLVMDEEEFENYPWGRVAFKNLIEAVKEAELWKSGYVLDGFVEVLQVWAYRFMPEFRASCGAPIRNAPDIPLLAYKESRWKWKPADWNPQGVLVKNPKPPEFAKGKDPQTLEMKCRRGCVLRAFPLLKMASVAFEEKLKLMFEDGFSGPHLTPTPRKPKAPTEKNVRRQQRRTLRRTSRLVDSSMLEPRRRLPLPRRTNLRNRFRHLNEG